MPVIRGSGVDYKDRVVSILKTAVKSVNQCKINRRKIIPQDLQFKAKKTKLYKGLKRITSAVTGQSGKHLKYGNVTPADVSLDEIRFIQSRLIVEKKNLKKFIRCLKNDLCLTVRKLTLDNFKTIAYSRWFVYILGTITASQSTWSFQYIHFIFESV